MFPRIPIPGTSGIPTYGLMVALGFVLALWLAERLAPRAGLPPQAVQDVAVWACLWGLVGAKIVLLVIDPPASWRDAWRTLFQGGVFYGGFLGAVAGIVVRCRQRGLDVHAVADVLAAPLALGQALGRIGCFLAGCCYGAACDMPWAVRYADSQSVAVESGLVGQPLHPVQLYEAAGNLVLCLVALALFRHRKFAGQVAWTQVALYAAMRIGIEHWRADERGSVGALSTSQAIGLAVLAVAVTLLVVRWRAWRRSPPPPGGPADAASAPPAGSA